MRLPGGAASLRGWAGAAPAPLLAARGRGGLARPCPGAGPHRRRPERSGEWGSGASGGNDAAEGAATARGLGGGAGLRREGVLHRPRQPHHQLGRPPRQVGGGSVGTGGRAGRAGSSAPGSPSFSQVGERLRSEVCGLGVAPRRVLGLLPRCPVGDGCGPWLQLGSAPGEGKSRRSFRYSQT